MSNHKQKEMKLKWLVSLFTTKKWRRHKRRIFFEKILEDLKVGREESEKYKEFSGIKSTEYTYENVCRELASRYDYNPFLDKSYKMNIGKRFQKYQDQDFDSLKVRIIRNSPILKCLTQKKGNFTIEVIGKEKERDFNFPYTKAVKIGRKTKSSV